MRAVDYASLVGKYVDMSRLANETEIMSYRALGLDSRTVGGSGLVAMVADANPFTRSSYVEVTFDYGMSFYIYDDIEWHFEIFLDEETAKEFKR